MSERSFALWSVGLALVFGIVVPEPGSPRAESAAGVAVAQPPASPDRPKVLEPLQAAPFAVSHAGGHAAPAKARAAPALLWAVNRAP
jgi:hypothetical protein